MIEILGSEGTAERRAAEQLRDFLLAWYPGALEDTQTHVSIFSSVQAFGQRTQDIDVLVMAQFGPRTPTVCPPGTSKNARLVSVAFTVEVKNHTVDDVRFVGTTVETRYGKQWKNASSQASEQMFALRKYLEERAGKAPFLVNFIWLRDVATDQLPTRPHNILGSDATWQNIVECLNDSRVGENLRNGSVIAASPAVIQECRDVLAAGIEPTNLDRRRIELISRRLVNSQRYVAALGTQLLVFRGRGGTGKTVNLLRLAHDLYRDRAMRVLLLTYNNALVSDLQRLLAIMKIDAGVVSRAIQVQTVHSFIFGLHDALLAPLPDGGSISHRYSQAKAELQLHRPAITPEDITTLKRTADGVLDWDFVLIDESQDWPEDERDLIYWFYGHSHVVLSDGVDQLTRQARATDWTSVVPPERRQIVTLRKTLRLKRNLCEFVQLLGKELNLGDLAIEPVLEQTGGLVTVLVGDYLAEREFHEKSVVALTQGDGNKRLDMLYCVSDSQIVIEPNGRRHSRAASTFTQWGEKVWDGVDAAARKSFPVSVDQLRIVQYESCRGLEAWTTVCLGADRFYERKLHEGRAVAAQEAQVLIDPEERAREYAARWLLIPFTRAIDWLIIEIESRESELGKILTRVTESLPEPTEWI